jgi:N-acyl-D-aspartate/D-glutamate deacylase
MLDYLIKNAMVVDGTGKAAYQAHVGVKGDRIAAIIADETLPEAKKVIEAEGQLLTPGFIDVHSHADVSLPVYPGGDNSIMQGVTTFVGGNCGMGVAPAYNEEFSRFYEGSAIRRLLYSFHGCCRRTCRSSKHTWKIHSV